MCEAFGLYRTPHAVYTMRSETGGTLVKLRGPGNPAMTDDNQMET
jgi:hypothetical protein